jgi:hypothetical protein
MATPPDFGGREIEEGRLEELGVPVHGDRAADPGDLAATAVDDLNDNEAHAPGATCARCGAVIEAGQDVRRRADGRWVHEVCP